MVVASEGAAEALIKAGEESESDRLLSPSMARCRGRDAPNHTVTRLYRTSIFYRSLMLVLGD